MSVYLSAAHNSERPAKRRRYTPPHATSIIPLSKLLALRGRTIEFEQGNLFSKKSPDDPSIYYSGDLSLLERPNVSVIGSRDVSQEGILRAHKVARQMAEAGVVVTSGLAKGVDTSAHTGALRGGGNTIAVIGTPLDRAYPAENAELQQTIYNEHLLISQFTEGSRTFPSDFPKRNKLMAALSDASIIVEASDSSGTLHQASECVRLKRWLFIMQSVVDNPRLTWPKKFLNEPTVKVLKTTEEVIELVSA